MPELAYITGILSCADIGYPARISSAAKIEIVFMVF